MNILKWISHIVSKLVSKKQVIKKKIKEANGALSSINIKEPIMSDKKYINVKSVSFWGSILSGIGAFMVSIDPVIPGIGVWGKSIIAFGATTFGIGIRAAIK